VVCTEVVSTTELSDTDPLYLHPNPASTEITLHWNSRFEPVSLKLFDVAGRLLQNSDSGLIPPYSIPLQSLPSGIYWISITDRNGKIWTKMVVKE
jgi:hypothetical protein